MPARAEGGWVLLEVLAALALLAVALAGLSEALSGGRRVAEVAAGRVRAVLAAESLLARLAAGPLSEGTRSGRLSDGQGWRAEISRHPANAKGAAGLPVLMRLKVVVGPVTLETARLSDAQ